MRDEHVFSSVATFMSETKSRPRYTNSKPISSRRQISGIATPVIIASTLSRRAMPPCNTYNIIR